jgi:hypothetical protein
LASASQGNNIVGFADGEVYNIIAVDKKASVEDPVERACGLEACLTSENAIIWRKLTSTMKRRLTNSISR